jgi:drug/metabolite transporter (DMT)-like permease
MKWRIQIRLRSMLLSMVWFAIWGASFVLLRKYFRHEPFPDEIYGANVVFYHLVTLAFVASPCVAIGALFGHTRRGIIAGVLLFIAFYAFVIVSVVLTPMSRGPAPAPGRFPPKQQVAPARQ